VQKCENFNAIEELIQIHSGAQEKGTVFTKLTQEFQSIYAPIETLEKQKAEVMNVIQQNMGPFSHLVSSAQADKGKQDFYQQLDKAVGGYFEITNMLHQANQFYTQLSDYLTKLFQNINDFKVSREFEKNDLIQRLSSFSGQQPPPGFQSSPPV
jgi:vacuolar-type H+-ATPase subunit D/Vma8